MQGRIRTIENYGGEYQDAEPVENAEIEQGADDYNRHAEDTAIMTRLIPAWVTRFNLQTTAASYILPASEVTVRGPGGTDTSMKPRVTKTATGMYSLSYPSSYTDSLDEEVATAFGMAVGSLISATQGSAQITSLSSGAATVEVRDSTGALSDLSGAGSVCVVCW